jgi:hypothetical protein
MSKQKICCSCYAIHARTTYRRLGGWCSTAGCKFESTNHYKPSVVRHMIFSKLSMGCNGVLTKQVAKHHCLDGSQLHEYTTIAQCYVSTDIGVQRPNNSTISPESIKSLPHPSISVVIVECCDGISAYSEDENLIIFTILLR